MCFEVNWLQNRLRATGNELRSLLAVNIQGHQPGGFCTLFSELCWGKAMAVYKTPQQKKKEACEKLSGERDEIKIIDLRFERW